MSIEVTADIALQSSPQKKVHSGRSSVVATGSALPSIRIDNDTLSDHLETSDEWIHERVGIRSRYVCAPDESTVTLAAKAARQALTRSNISANSVDVVLVATVTPDKHLPSAAALLCKELGIENALAFDIHAACSGFLFGVQTAEALLQATNGTHALIVGSESLSRIINWKDRNTAVLFGDGAGAALIRRPMDCQESFIRASYLKTLSDGSDLIQRSGGAFPTPTCPVSGELPCEVDPYVAIQGREVFKSGIHLMTASINEVLTAADVAIDDIAVFIPHQSNIRMINAVCNTIGLNDFNKVVTNIERVGNTSAASIPIALNERVETHGLQSGDLVLMTAVGSGMTYGSLLVEW